MLRFLREAKGQGALEYILIVGAAVLIAAIVIAIIASAGKRGKSDVNEALTKQQEGMNALKKEVPDFENIAGTE